VVRYHVKIMCSYLKIDNGNYIRYRLKNYNLVA